MAFPPPAPTAAFATSLPLRGPRARHPSLSSRHPSLSSRPLLSMTASAPTDEIFDVAIIGSGFGGLCAAAITTALGKKTVVLESHYRAGGVAHGFAVRNGAGAFHFDTGPSFYCGLSPASCGGRSVNPVKLALDAVGEAVACVAYGDTGYIIDDLERRRSIRVCEDEEASMRSVGEACGPGGVDQLRRFNKAMRDIHKNLRVPAIALRADKLIIPVVFRRWALEMLQLLPYVGVVKRPVSEVMARVGVVDPVVRQYLDTEAFLLSGLKTDATITAEIAFMVGEREKKGGIEYPLGGATAIIDALVRGIEKSGGTVMLNSHVESVEIKNGRAEGVVVRGRGKAPSRLVRVGRRGQNGTVISNATGWQTFGNGPHALVAPEHLPKAFVKAETETPAVESFMHVHIAIPSAGLPKFDGHHAVIIDSARDIAEPGNTVMFSCPTVWDPSLAPDGYHIIHAYTLEPFERWPGLSADRAVYEAAKKQAAEPLMKAIRSVIPDLDARLEDQFAICKIGSPLTHARFCRRYKGSYGPAIRAGESEFPWPRTPVSGLLRVGDSVFPGIGTWNSTLASACVVAIANCFCLVSFSDLQEFLRRQRAVS